MDLDVAIQQLQRVLASERRSGPWSWQVRQHLGQVRHALECDRVRSFDGWLNARASHTDRVRRQLMARISAITDQEQPDADRLRGLAARLLTDLEHFQQRVRDLNYDAVALEIGGSE